MKSLYRRYRPLRLEDVVGQPQVTEPLIKSLEQNRVSHAYLFIGPRGCGKTSVARILAHQINGFDYSLEDDYVDIIEIDGASNRGIDNIRDLREKVAISPTTGKYKVYIIDEVHMLTNEAFNALLKTLEEPPSHAVFIMATTDAHKVPVTITSRAQTYTFRLADHDLMLDFLKTVAKKESIKIDDDALSLIAKKGGGSFRDSLSLLDQISTLSDKGITKEQVISAMGLPDDEKITGIINDYCSGNNEAITRTLRELFASGIKPETLVDEMISTIMLGPKLELMPLLSRLSEIKAPYVEARLLVALLSTSNTAANTNSQNHNSSSQNHNSSSSTTSKTLNAAETKEIQPSSQPRKKEPNNNQPTNSSSFDWNSFVNKVYEISDAVYSQLIKTNYEYENGVLHIYPGKKIVKTILSLDNNKKILYDALNGDVKITIHDVNDAPKKAKKDEILDHISDIMGGEVKNDGGKSPF